MISDINLFFERILQYAISNSPQLGLFLMSQEKEVNEKYFAEMLGLQLARMFDQNNSNEMAGSSNMENTYSLEQTSDYSELERKNENLAAALGACVCWGELKDCVNCQGQGSPGWYLPDKQLFQHYVHPAIYAMKNFKSLQKREHLHIRNY